MLSTLVNAAYSVLEERARVKCTKETCPIELSVRCAMRLLYDLLDVLETDLFDRGDCLNAT